MWQLLALSALDKFIQTKSRDHNIIVDVDSSDRVGRFPLIHVLDEVGLQNKRVDLLSVTERSRTSFLIKEFFRPSQELYKQSLQYISSEKTRTWREGVKKQKNSSE